MTGMKEVLINAELQRIKCQGFASNHGETITFFYFYYHCILFKANFSPFQFFESSEKIKTLSVKSKEDEDTFM